MKVIKKTETYLYSSLYLISLQKQIIDCKLVFFRNSIKIDYRERIRIKTEFCCC